MFTAPEELCYIIIPVYYKYRLPPLQLWRVTVQSLLGCQTDWTLAHKVNKCAYEWNRWLSCVQITAGRNTQDETRYVSQLNAKNGLHRYLKIVACVCREIFTCIDAMMESPCRERLAEWRLMRFFTEPQCNNIQFVWNRRHYRWKC